jgi:transcriptional regulator with XRE-family HTH domain
VKTAEALFGQEVKKIRAERGFSQEELSFQADIHTSYVSQLERGKKSPSLRTILQIARALDTSATELMRAVEDGLSK